MSVENVYNEEFKTVYLDGSNHIVYGIKIDDTKLNPNITQDITDTPGVSGADLDYVIDYMEYYNRLQKDL